MTTLYYSPLPLLSHEHIRCFSPSILQPFLHTSHAMA